MIRKAKRDDFEEYLKLKRQEEKDYSKIIGRKITYPKDNVLKKEFNKALSSKKHLILVEEENKILIGYLHGTYFSNPYSKGGNVEDVFVLKEFRRKGIAKSMIAYFIKLLKNKGYKKIQLSVNTKNVHAIKLYEKLGFEVFHWDLKKEWK
jgi:ribosomal protein S18 acetylase RimI-like enzyme